MPPVRGAYVAHTVDSGLFQDIISMWEGAQHIRTSHKDLS